MSLKLANVPTEEILHDQVAGLFHDIQSRDAATLSRIKPFLENLESVDEDFSRRMIARDYGFSSWDKLLERAKEGSASGADQFAPDQIACEFLRLVVLVYSETENADPQRFIQAAELLKAYPEIRSENIYTAAAIGDAEKVNEWLAHDPSLINNKGGFHGWEPIMYAAYARLPGHSSLEAGRVLLQQGADANAHYMWGGQYRFTALTGVFGQGEGGPERLPEHPDTEAFARLLLSAGADPNDGQAAYNRMFEPDNLYLELLLEYGIGLADKNNWLLHDEETPGRMRLHTEGTLHYQLCHAIRQGFIERVELLVKYKVDINQLEVDASIQRKPIEIALLSRQAAIADCLLSQGATEPDFDAVDQFYIACFSGDEAVAQALLSKDAELVTATQSRYPGILAEAVDRVSPDVLAMMLQLGFDPNAMHYRTALHQAAWKGESTLLKILIAAGGDTSIRDHHYYAAPIGWALEHNQTEAVEFLEGCNMDIFTAVGRGLTSIVNQQLTEDRSRLEHRFLDYRPNHQAYCASDWCTPLAFALRINHPEMVEFLLELGARTDIKDEKGQGLDTLLTEWAEQGDHQTVLKYLKHPT